MELKVIDLCEERAKEARKIERMRQLVEGREHNARVTERYLNLYRHCFSGDRLLRLELHLADVIRSLRHMRIEYDNMLNT